jgi:hypothetical protein
VGPRAGADDVDESGIEERADCVWRCCAEPGHLHRADGDRVGLRQQAIGEAGSAIDSRAGHLRWVASGGTISTVAGFRAQLGVRSDSTADSRPASCDFAVCRNRSRVPRACREAASHPHRPGC